MQRFSLEILNHGPSFRVLEWDAYDIILGMDWLRYWKAIWNREGSKLSLSNRSDKPQSVEMRPFGNIDSEGLNGSWPQLAQLCNCKGEINKHNAAADLYIIKGKAREARPATSLSLSMPLRSH